MCLNRTFNDINFNVRINNFHFLNTELIKGNKYIKSKNVDMLIETDDIVCNIEVNKIFNRKTIIRNYAYQSNCIASMVKVNKSYQKNFKHVVQVNYNLKMQKKYPYEGTYIDSEKEKHTDYECLKTIINVNIAKYIDEWYNSNKDRDYYEKYKHFLIFGMTEKDLEELEDDDTMIGKIKNEIFDLNKPELFPKLFTDEEFLEVERNDAIAEGIEQGIVQNKLESAKAMKAKGFSVKDIIEITNLDIKTIESL